MWVQCGLESEDTKTYEAALFILLRFRVDNQLVIVTKWDISVPNYEVNFVLCWTAHFVLHCIPESALLWKDVGHRLEGLSGDIHSEWQPEAHHCETMDFLHTDLQEGLEHPSGTHGKGTEATYLRVRFCSMQGKDLQEREKRRDSAQL